METSIEELMKNEFGVAATMAAVFPYGCSVWAVLMHRVSFRQAPSLATTFPLGFS